LVRKPPQRGIKKKKPEKKKRKKKEKKSHKILSPGNPPGKCL
jgi:hypothetical protein